MSLITTISGVPLFTTVQEALAYALKRGSKSYHIHDFNGQMGFMGGANHSAVSGPMLSLDVPTVNITRANPQVESAVVITPVTPRVVIQSQPVSSSVTSSGSSGSGGGGGGY
tara:strand:+ start:257 stop:592 length:336 start_codon:yes stop_codon:yes gene_type:complete